GPRCPGPRDLDLLAGGRLRGRGLDVLGRRGLDVLGRGGLDRRGLDVLGRRGLDVLGRETSISWPVLCGVPSTQAIDGASGAGAPRWAGVSLRSTHGSVTRTRPDLARR